MFEAKSRGFDNCLVCDMLGNVAELANSNVFMGKDGVVFTPMPNGTFLNGITRQRVIKLMREAGVSVVESVLRYADFEAADEIFATGNASKVLPITRIGERALQPGPLYRKARELYWAFAHGFVRMTAQIRAGVAVSDPARAAGPARAQDDVDAARLCRGRSSARTPNTSSTWRGITRQLLRSGAPLQQGRADQGAHEDAVLQQGALFAFCAAEAERDRAPGAARVPAENNLMLTTCVEIKLGAIAKFTQLAAYADFFFPERIESCGEQSRLPSGRRCWRPMPSCRSTSRSCTISPATTNA